VTGASGSCPAAVVAAPVRGTRSGRTAGRAVLWWAAGLAGAILHAGLWATPNLETFASAAASFPGAPPAAGGPGDYVLATLSTLGLGRVLGWTEPQEFARLHLLLVAIVTAGLVALAWRRGGLALARGIAVVLAASPLLSVSLQWLGQPDILTGGSAIAAVLVRRRRWIVALGAIAGWTHPEQAVLAFAAVVLVRWAWPEPDDRRDGRRGVALDAAAAVGSVLVAAALGRLWLAVADVTISRSRLEFLELGLPAFAEHHAADPPALLWNLLGPLWLVLGGLVAAVALTQWRPGGGRLARSGLAVALAALLPTFLTLDETRVFAVVSAPTLVVLAWFVARLPERIGPWAAAAVLVVTAAVPAGFSTGTSTWRHRFDSRAMAEFLVDGRLPADAPALGLWLLAPLEVRIPTLPDGD
jgi:hypothetical protein